jgi:hypothetical protein
LSKRIELLEKRFEEKQGEQEKITAPPTPQTTSTGNDEELRELATELKNKFTFILGAAHQAAFKRLPRRSKQGNKKKLGRQDEEDSEAEETNDVILTNEENTIDFLDIVGGVNFKVENHRKRLRYIENLDTATA